MIRPLGISDMDTVLRIWKTSNLQAHSFVPSGYWERNVELVRKAMSDAEVWIYESDGRIVGFVGLAGDYIAGIFVEMECRSRGIGHALLDFLKKRHRFLCSMCMKRTAVPWHFIVEKVLNAGIGMWRRIPGKWSGQWHG